MESSGSSLRVPCCDSCPSRDTGCRRTQARPKNVSKKKLRNMMKRVNLKTKKKKKKKEAASQESASSESASPESEYDSDGSETESEGHYRDRPVGGTYLVSPLDPEVVEVAEHVISQHNNRKKVKKLEFVKIIKGTEILARGFLYHLFLVVREIDANELQFYETKTYSGKEPILFRKAPPHLMKGWI